MNTTELKSHFYKRFTGENGRMTLSEAGLPCSLLGYINTDHMPSISCSISMRVNIIARRIGSQSVTMTSTATDMCRTYRIDSRDGRDKISAFLNRARDFGLCGAQLLSDNKIPVCFDPHISYTAAAAKALLELSKRGVPDSGTCAALCAMRNELNAYLSVFASERGYCVYVRDGAARNLPMPMTGFKFILINVREAAPPVSSQLAEKTYMILKELYPHITSFADISAEMLDIAAPRLKSHEVRMCAHHMADECRRIRNSVHMLTKCDIKSFAGLMNESCYSQKRLCAYNDARVFLSDELRHEEGVLGTRMCEHGVIALVDEERCNSIIRSLKFSYETEFGCLPVFCIADII